MEYNWDDDEWGNGTDMEEDYSWSTGSSVGLERPSAKTYGPRKFNRKLFIHALVGALVGAVIGQLIYGAMYNSAGSNVLMAGLILGVVALCILVACAVCEMRDPRLTVDQEMSLKNLGMMLAGAVLVFAVGCGTEFLYELGSAYTPVEFNDFVFVIDDSGSMSSTDPQNMRYQALAQLLDSMEEDKRAGLLRFNDVVSENPIKMDYLTDAQRGALSDGISQYQSEGGTDIYLALQKALDMAEQNKVSGRAPVVVLLSDGGSSVPINRLANQYLSAGVAISTVSLGNGADEGLLQNIAQVTGGQFFRVEDADDLVGAFQQVSKAVTYRCLFSPRPGMQRNSVPYMLLRVVFLLLPALLIAVTLIVSMQGQGMEPQLLVSAVAGLLAGLVMEVGTYHFLPLGVIHILSWVLYGVVLLYYMDLHSDVRQGGLKGVDVDDSDGAFNAAMRHMDDLQEDALRRQQDTEREKSIGGRPMQ